MRERVWIVVCIVLFWAGVFVGWRQKPEPKPVVEPAGVFVEKRLGLECQLHLADGGVMQVWERR